ncbi:GMC family oxidoreductase N-terminal domain-containing protein [Nonomuraea sp. SMC257]|uniref:GMC family oxidoreductase N-terminal domain-containing protein n=1 Tax=Nonomuraea montanisoli TaxID=2741721 RepID=A0A7Y6M7Y7_9ACTN|nr:GMC family oxidoreductase N-terminal domain-containing protein [Nonomuraea montanisoli]
MLARSGERIEAGEVVLTAGALSSPVVLMRSGVGPANELARAGVKPVHHLSGVGHGLCRGSGSVRAPGLQVLMRTGRARREHFARFLISALKPTSEGSLRLCSPDPYEPALIHRGLLRERADTLTLAEGMRAAREIATADPIAGLLESKEDAQPPGEVQEDGSLMERWLRENVRSYHHPVGTCRIGPDPAKGAVVSSEGTLYGLGGLTVADASIMPCIPSANTNLSTIMLAEHLARHFDG